MKADLTRNTFDPLKHYARVLMQQGRVQLDSDWNEQSAILVYHQRALAADLIGQAGGSGSGFAIKLLPINGDFGIELGHYYVDGVVCEADSEAIEIAINGSPAGGSIDIVVDQWTLNGQPFANNQLVEVFDDVPLGSPAFQPTIVRITAASQPNKKLTLNGVPAKFDHNALNPCLRAVITYLTQPDYPAPDKIQLASEATWLVYLDAWERHLTYIEDGSIREVALGGPDTASRGKLVWQVKVIQGQPTKGTATGTGNLPAGKGPWDGFTPTDSTALTSLLGRDRGRLKAMAKQSSASTNPCIIAPDASYQGPENQLYRVEIHSPGIAAKSGGGTTDSTDSVNAAGIATFKWSRENGSVTYPIVGAIGSGGGVTTITLASLGRDDRYGLAEGDWVEIQDDDYMLMARAGNLLKVQSIDRGNLQVTLTGTADPGVGTDPAKHPMLRRWEQKQGDPAEGGLTLAANGTALIEEHNDTMWLTLEDGVQIQFQPAPSPRDNLYRTGDYWLIPARTATANVEWPSETVTDAQGNTTTTPLARPPLGIQHHYAPLGMVTVASGGKVSTTGSAGREGFKTMTGS